MAQQTALLPQLLGSLPPTPTTVEIQNLLCDVALHSIQFPSLRARCRRLGNNRVLNGSRSVGGISRSSSTWFVIRSDARYRLSLRLSAREAARRPLGLRQAIHRSS